MNRQELEKRLFEQFKNADTEDPTITGVTLRDYLKQLSEDISGVVTPLDAFNVNFVVAMLEAYAQSIRQTFPCDDEAIECIKSLNTAKITMVMPTDMIERDEDED